MSKKRTAIYVFYDKDGIADSYVIYMLQEILKVCDRLVVVVNGLITNEGESAIRYLTGDLLVRENKGFDAWGFKAGLEYIGWDNLKQYDELVLLNDTVYGPIYPFQIMFDEMDIKGLDFWGITKHGQIADPFGLTKEGIFPEHIQSYFYVINKNMHSHPEFRSYWDDLPVFNKWDEAVSLHEVQFTRHFAERGFSWGAYVDTEKRLKGISETCLLELMTYELVRYCKLPVIKRKNFSTEYDGVLGTTVGDSTKKAFDYISKKTNYDVNLIWENILRTMQLRAIKDNLDLNYVLPADYNLENDHALKIALFMHITYEDQIEFCASYAHSIPPNADIFITTEPESMKDKLLDRFGAIKCNKLEVLVLPEKRKGRDVSALWVAFRPFMGNYDYICFTHNKKSLQDKPFTIGRGFAQRCFENNLASREYVDNILAVFEANPRLGMLFPPPVIHGRYNDNISCQWGLNYKKTVELAKRLDIKVPMDEKDPVFPAGGMFWFKTKALRKLVEHDWKYDDFPGEPLRADGTLNHAFERIYCFAAQSEGYYSAWVMTIENAQTEITSMNYLLTKWHSPERYEIRQDTKPTPARTFQSNDGTDRIDRLHTNAKNVAIYVFYDKEGIVDDYVIFMLQDLLKVTDRLIVVCNGELTPEGRQKLCGITEEILVRDNIGWDAWAYKAGMDYIGWGTLQQYDNLILLNDSVYGPFYPLKCIFEEMGRKNLDFWGITKHGESTDYSGLAPRSIYPEHIQSYFYAIGNRMLSSPEFKSYWDNLREFRTWSEAIAFHEVVFTKHFSDRGYTWDVYVNTDKELGLYSNVAQIHQMIFELVSDYKCPIIKRKNFTIDYGNFFMYTPGDSTRKALDYIRDNTDYDTDLIWDNILRTASLKNIKDNLHLNYLLPEDHIKDYEPDDTANMKIALFVHLTREDQIELFCDYIESVPGNTDVYITTTSEKMKTEISKSYGGKKPGELVIRVLQASDCDVTDVSSLWVVLKPHMAHYDYICVIHDRKMSDLKPETIGREATFRCLGNTLASKEYVINILRTFKQNPRLGIVFPPPPYHDGFSLYTPAQMWGSDYPDVVTLAEKLNIIVPSEEDLIVFPYGGMFWFRPGALKKLIDYEWNHSSYSDKKTNGNEFPGRALEKIYCYAARSEGYYSAWVMTDSTTLTEITALRYLLTKAHRAQRYPLLSKIIYYAVTLLRRSPGMYGLVRRFYLYTRRVRRKLTGKFA